MAAEGFRSVPHAPAMLPSPYWLSAACLAVAFPTLLAFNLPPSPTFFNQAMAFVGWGVWGLLLASAAGSRSARPADPGHAALLAALAVMAIAAAVSPLWSALPWTLALSYLGSLLAAMLVAMLGASLTGRGRGVAAFHAFCGALLVAGVLGAAISLIQVFVPQWVDGRWIAAASDSGRAAGNLRQPNHLSSLLLWSLVALAWLAERERIGRVMAPALGLLMLAGIVLTASRTGAVGILLLAAWGWRDRITLSRRTRIALLAAPLAYVALWAAFTYFKHLAGEAFSGEEQLVRSDFSSSRFAIWSDTLAMIARQPWLGVGWGEFNFAWTLTPFPDRPTAFFDHTHNLPLQLAVELGVPLALLVLALFAWSLWRAFRAAEGVEGPLRLTLRAAFMMVLMMALHSQLEYPLWYAYFLLPTAFAWGLCLGRPGASEAAAEGSLAAGTGGAVARPLWLASALLAAGGAAALYDYSRVVPIFSPGSDARPLAERIAAGQRSLLFGHHADYAVATSEASSPAQALAASHRAVHYLLDSRLMEAWAKTFEATGDDARARYVAARLTEFRNDGNDAFFELCREAEEEGGMPTATGRQRCRCIAAGWRVFRSGRGCRPAGERRCRRRLRAGRRQRPAVPVPGAAQRARLAGFPLGAVRRLPAARVGAGVGVGHAPPPQAATKLPDLPPCFSSTRTPSMTMPRSTALHMS